MNTMNRNVARTPAAMIEQALALLAVIDVAQADEDIDEFLAARETRVTLRAMAGRLVTEMIANLQPTVAVPMRLSVRSPLACVTGGISIG